MVPATINMISVVKGDTWDGFNEVSITVDGNIPPDELTSVSMTLRKQDIQNAPIAKSITSANGGITITSAENWIFTVNPTVMGIDVGIYSWAMTTTDVAGTVKTYITGTFEILKA